MDAFCQYCGMIHTAMGLCHRVQSIEYYPDGTVKTVTLFPLFQPLGSTPPTKDRHE